MGIKSLLRFVNRSDLREAAKNPHKAIRAIDQIVAGEETTNVADTTAYDEVQIDISSRLFDVDRDEVEGLLTDVRTGPIDSRIQACERQLDEKPYSIGGMILGGEMAYLLTRLLTPDAVLEIGVANGISSAYLLGALDEMEVTADVRAIDKPQFESDIRSKRGSRGLSGVGGIIPDEKEAGWVTPLDQRLRHGYQYYVGDFTEILPMVTDSMPNLDLAVYDASKDPREMEIAYETLIQSLSPGGVLLSDDVNVNDAFSRVTTRKSGTAYEFGGIGVFRSSDG